MEKVKGRDLRVYVGTKLLANEKSCKVNLSTNSIDTVSKDSGDWAESIPGRKSWSIDATLQIKYGTDTQKETYADLLAAWLNKSVLTVSFKDPTVDSTTLTGSAYLTSFPHNSPDEDIATVDVTFTGTGPLTAATVSA
jgi:predicted secreted protein